MSERMFLLGLVWINAIAIVVMIALKIFRPAIAERIRRWLNINLDARIGKR